MFQRRLPAVFVCAGVIIGLSTVSCAVSAQDAPTALASHSFKSPYNSFDTEGKRQIPNFAYGGNVDVNENFIRVTPDRASKRGWIWSRSALDANEWTATLRFRVSGQGKRLFGDGFALWFTQNRFHADGALHGFAPKFTGFGIIFDTFRNSELNHVHKDVALYINNGNEALDPASMKDVTGCDSDFRYWEGRDDFNVANKSVAKITLKDNKVSVEIDARNSGTFKTCFKDIPLNLPDGWHKTGYLGLTATTGQLADNHDILSMLVSPKADEVLHDKEVVAPASLPSSGNEQVDALVKAAVAAEIKALEEKLTDLHHLLEHQLSAVNDALQNNIKKLQEQDNNNVHRIIELETKLHMKVENDVNSKVSDVVDQTLEHRLEQIEQIMHDKFDMKLQEELEPRLDAVVEKQMDSVGRSWKLPFFLLVGVVGGISAVAYRKYRHLMKTHLL